MAASNIVYELMAKLGLDSTEYEQGMKDAEDTAEKGGGGIQKAFGTVAKVGAAALAAATTAVVAFGKSSVDAGMQFDSSMSQVAATMGYTVEELNDSNSEAAQTFETLSKFAQEMGRDTSFSASEAADALNYMALAGYDAETSMEMLPNVLNLAAAGNIDLAAASDMVTDAQSALGLTLPQTAEMVDQMAKASSRSNTSVAELGEAFLTIGANARSVKGGTAELSTVLGVLADNGIKGAEGGTHLRNMIMSLQNPTEDGAKALNDLGVSVYDADGNMRSLIEILQDMQKGMEGMDQASRDAMINGIFNKTDAAAAKTLIETTAERFDELTQAIEGSAGAAENMANTQLDNLAGDVTRFQSALEAAKITLSSKLTPALRGFVQFGTSGIQKLTTAFEEGGLEGAMNALTGIIDEGINMIFQALPKVVKVGASLVKSLVSGIIKNLPTLMDAAIEIILSLAEGIIEYLPELIPAIVDVITTIVEKLTDPDTLTKLITAAIQIIMALAEGLIEALPKLIEAGPTIISNLVKALIENAPMILKASVDLIGALVTGIVDSIPLIIEGCKTIFETIKQEFTEHWPEIKEHGKQLIIKLATGIAEVLSVLLEQIGVVLTAVSDAVSKKWEEIKEKTSEAWTKLKEKTVEIWQNMKTSVSTVIDNLKNNAQQKWNNIKTAVTTIANNIKTSVVQVWENLKNTVQQKIDNLKTGISQRFENIRSTISGILDRIKGLFNFEWSFPHIKLPHFSWYMESVGGLFSIPRISVDWYKKAYDEPYVFSKPTVMGFGDGDGGEMVYGHENLIRDIENAVKDALEGEVIPIVLQNILDGRVLSETVTKYQRKSERAYA